MGAGSFERTECTRASSRCIWAVRDRICDSEFEAGILCDVDRLVVVRGAGVRVALVVVDLVPVGRLVVDVENGLAFGFGVML
jgi:hypothetical protein